MPLGFSSLRTAFLSVFILASGLMTLPHPAQAADWQWSVPVNSAEKSENPGQARAFLWIPPDCTRVRAVIVGQHNMEEEPILEHPGFRRAMARLGVAEVWVTPALDLFFRFDRGAGEHFTAMMDALAAESGYKELAFAPVIPIGHSAAASYPWNFAALNPGRTLAVLSISGQWPYYKDVNTPDWGDRNVDGIPGLVSMGEYEGAQSRAGTGLGQRTGHPKTALTMLCNPGSGHFDATDEKINFLAGYIAKAIEYRLPADAPADRAPVLKPIDPTQQGWLVDRWRGDQPPKAPAAPVDRYTGDPKDAFWCFDADTARAVEKIGAQYRGKKTDLVGYVQAGGIAPQNPNLHAQVNLRFEPEADGITFKLTGAFLDTVPPGRPEGWTGLKAGSTVGHATGGGPVIISRICGPVAQTGPDTFAIRFYRMGMDNPKRSNEIWLEAVHPGDDAYRRTVQQAVMHFPLQNTAGSDQTITFSPIPDQRQGVKTLTLKAGASSGLPVHFYVREGPAEMKDDNTLVFTSIPPRAKFPVKVTVVAWQWGRTNEPRLKTAIPVEHTFLINR